MKISLLSSLFCFRNRLENNSDHWNALFLSLRELAEWTVKKESELETMSPIGGDENTIRKQQVKNDQYHNIKLIVCQGITTIWYTKSNVSFSLGCKTSFTSLFQCGKRNCNDAVGGLHCASIIIVSYGGKYFLNMSEFCKIQFLTCL